MSHIPNNKNPVQPSIPIEQNQMEVRIQFPTEGGLGLAIAGGVGSTPFKGNDSGIFISQITKNGPADYAGLQVSDKVLSVDGYNLIDVDHDEAVAVFRRIGSFISFVVLREKGAVMKRQSDRLV